MKVYRFAWKNREIPKGSLLILEAVGKLNSVLVRSFGGTQRWVTDRRALRIVKELSDDRGMSK